MNTKEIIRQQQELCKQFGVEFIPTLPHLKVGVARNVREGILPINGLRHSPTGDTTGWYVWAGEELNTDPDFFVPVHAEHLKDWCPVILRFLGLPPGWRFLIAGEYEDIWEDPSLLVI